MAYINEDKKQEILNRAQLDNTLKAYHPDGKKKGSQIKYTCPLCHTEEKLEFSPAKNIVKCFKCNEGASDPVNYLQKFHGLDFPQALESLAQIESISLAEDKPRKKRTTKKKVATSDKPKAKPVRSKEKQEASRHTFCANKLDSSGLTTEDVTASVVLDGDTNKLVPTFRAATIDEYWEIIPGDDIIIDYYDLEGNQMYYYRRDKRGNPTGNKRVFRRIRYQNPELHKDKNGNAAKYKSPYGSDSKIYIPQAIRNKYKKQSKITTLYIQEGELKAEKATKHGLISVGVMGIHNIAYNNKLPREFEMIIKRCQVDNVVFVLDSDWDQLSSKIDSNHSADMRPKNFFTAVLNFQKHFYAFTNNDIHLKIYFGYVLPNPEKDKGIDDLLTNSLRGKEDTLKSLCAKALTDPEGDAQWLKFHDITSYSDYKLKAFWHLENKDSFVKHYGDRLKDLPEFKFGKVKWRIAENGEVELAQPLLDHEQYWKEDKTSKGTNVSFNYKRCYTFLQNRGFFRYAVKPGKYIWIHIEDNVVTEVDSFQIKDYVINFTKEISREDVENLLYSGGDRYLGPNSMGNLAYTGLNVHRPGKGIQYLYFKDSYWKISADGIEPTKLKEIQGHVWKDKLRDFEPEVIKNGLFSELHQITAEDCKDAPELKKYIGEWTLDFSEEGKKCDFLQFLLNTSRFNNKPLHQYEIDEAMNTNRHLLSKLTAIGYMLHRHRDASRQAAVIGMDVKMSEVGTSNGRSGKSLIGIFLENMVPTVTIPGKKKDLLDDRFVFEEVDERTEVVFIDDVRINFDFEMLFPYITGKFTVEKKGMGKMTLASELTQKFYITTNHAIRGEGGSFKDRQITIGFSDWYNDKHKPTDDFGSMFFDEWDNEQYNLVYNLAATCLHLYFKYGIIEAPTEELEKRRVRQELGESFLDWANEYFSNPNNLNDRLSKHDMYESPKNNPDHVKTHGEGFKDRAPHSARYTNITSFKKKLKQYCDFKGYLFNPSMNGGDIKTGGKEYIEIGVNEELYAVIEEAYFDAVKIAENDQDSII